MQSGSSCVVVYGNNRSVHKWGGGNQVLARVLVRCDKGIGGLAGGNHNGVSCEGFYIGGIDFHDCQFVSGDFEEELFIERSIDDAEQVGLAAFYRQLKAACILLVYISYLYVW